MFSGLASVTIFVLSDDVASGTAITLLTGQLKTSSKLPFFHVSYYDTSRLTHVASLKSTLELFLKRIFAIASHLVMGIWGTLTAVDALLFTLFD